MAKQTFVTKTDFIYQSMREDIVEGNLRAGERIVIADMCKKYEVSAMPVREVLYRLQQDGLVEIIPHVGAKVNNFDAARFEEIMIIRLELEVLATKLSVPFINDQIIKELENLDIEMVEAIERQDYIRYGKLNKEFHLKIYCAGPYPVLHDLILSLWSKSEISRTIFALVPERVKASPREHRAWLNAIKEKDVDKACQVIRQQKEVGFNEFLEYMKKKNL